MDPKLKKILDEILETQKAIMAERVAKGEEIRALARDVEALKAAGKPDEAKAAGADVQTKLAELVALQEKHNAQVDRFNELESKVDGLIDGAKKGASRRGAPAEKRKVEFKSPGEAYVGLPEYKKLQKTEPAYAKKIGLKPSFSFKGCFLGGYECETKASELWDPTVSLPLEEQDNEVIRTPPKSAISCARRVFDVRPLVGRDSINLKSQTRAMEAVMRGTANTASGNNTITVNRLAGLSTVAPFDTIYVWTTATAETFTVTSIAPTSALDKGGPGVITLSGNLAANFDIGELVTFDVANFVDGAELRPKARAVFTESVVSLENFSFWTEVTKDQIRESENAETIINEDLLDDLAWTEEMQVFQGDGSTGSTGGGAFTGILNTSGISTVTWSTEPTGTTRLKMVSKAINTVELLRYIPKELLLYPTDFRLLSEEIGTDGQYIFVEFARSGDVPMMIGLRVEKSLAIPLGYGIVCDGKRAVRIYDSMAGTIETGHIDDQLVRGTMTIVATIRSALHVPHPGAICKIYWDAPPA